MSDLMVEKREKLSLETFAVHLFSHIRRKETRKFGEICFFVCDWQTTSKTFPDSSERSWRAYSFVMAKFGRFAQLYEMRKGVEKNRGKKRDL